MQPNDPDRDPVYEEYLMEITHGLPWHSAQKLLYSIEQDRKAKAAAIAKRLLGKEAFCSQCGGSYTISIGLGFCSLECMEKYEDGH